MGWTQEFRAELMGVVTHYGESFPGEAETIRPVQEFLRETENVDLLFARKNFVGHITGSGFVLSRAGRVLLIHHCALDRFLQPGGHVDRDETPLEAARREVAEETGLHGLELLSCSDFLTPWDVDSHEIPAKPKRGEPAHVHHDFRYLFRYSGEEDAVRANESEVRAYRWADLREMAQMPEFVRVVGKLSS